MYRAGLAAMLERMGDYESRESSTEPAQLIATLQDAPVLAALVVAVDLPQLVPLVQLLRSQQPKLSIILVSDDDESPVQVTEGVRLGASAILDTDSSPREFRAAAASVAAGGLFIARTCVERIGVRRVPLRPAAPSATVLSPRQREVLAMVADGMTSAEIASALHVSPRTVDSHRLAISKRLGIRNVADLLRYAIRERLVST